LLDLLYPRACAGCGRPDPEAGRYVCWDCLARIDFVQPPFCELCGDPVSGRIGHAYRCVLCADRDVHFDQARSVARYDSPVGRMIRNLKYHAQFWLIDDLADLLAAGVRAHYDPHGFDAVAAVPLHVSKQRARGFNQSAWLAAALGRRLRLPMARRCLRRTRADRSQTHLTVSQRADNVHNAFDARWNRWLEGRRILLVDDVMTTGATVNDCARALKAGGVASVRVITLARG
jgi:ComF family protein